MMMLECLRFFLFSRWERPEAVNYGAELSDYDDGEVVD